ncbi:acyl-CoA thioesterase II [Marinobacter litoralis]|uniref:Acyl-CoA thioesterase II n=1 Tax=Marinobacter litoralis TaxID=187981 RepID=A0A3M2RJ70_9GAMM|nr:thioesterase family protein [Marinobacter litoralis]RMJ05383.1 acyl-CoA thioesterase II [Marinobacter litoralis]
MRIDELLEGVRQGLAVVIPASWGQGRASFGGVVAALTYEVVASRVAPGRPVRAMQVSFVGPVEADVPAVFEVEVLREGKAASQVTGRIVQNGEPRLVCLASFGGDRDSAVQVTPIEGPVAKPVEECPELPYIKGVTPEFTQHIEMRWAFGNMPFSGKGGREMGGWMQFREAPDAMTDAHIIALADAWPPAILPYLKGPAPASSLSWNLEIIHPRPVIAPGDWLLYRATVDQAGSGYGHTHAGIWTASGELVALSRQAVTVFG